VQHCLRATIIIKAEKYIYHGREAAANLSPKGWRRFCAARASRSQSRVRDSLTILKLKSVQVISPPRRSSNRLSLSRTDADQWPRPAFSISS
jgi:hypothetical protein